jgi:hypothetical protein
MVAKVISAAAQLVEQQKRKYLTNKKAIINGHFGITVLNEVLQQLQDRIDYTGTVAVDQEGMLMREAVGDVIELAYSDFATFLKNWEVTVYYCDSITESNIYVLYFSEIGGQRQYHFRFTGLKQGPKA